MDRSTPTKQNIAALAAMARLELPEERQELVAESLGGIFQSLNTLDDVSLNETAPAFSYRAKWESDK